MGALVNSIYSFLVLQSLCVSGHGEDGACVQHNSVKLGRRTVKLDT